MNRLRHPNLIVATFTGSDLHEAPWTRREWSGQIISIDGASIEDSMRGIECVKRIIGWGTTSRNDWDGDCAGVVHLMDGRFCAWESNWGPTGSGFSADAYGGGADILVARELTPPLLQALSERAQELLAFSTTPFEATLVSVLCDEIERGATRPRLMEIASDSGEFGVIFKWRVDDIIRRWRPLTATEVA